ncbi:hypothetical protein F183_A28940 [Bryobacterales bacterium F-183]|nr:hypothetical protein F183_A28940 [Bryobacterales bacterium F-183]
MYPHQDLWTAFLATARDRELCPALDFTAAGRSSGAETLTFGELKTAALRAAALLVHLGVTQGDVVAIQLRKTKETYALILGCLRIGAIYVCLDPNSPPERLKRMLNRLQPKMLFAETAAESLRSGRITTIDRHHSYLQLASWPSPLCEDEANRDRSLSRPAYIMFTSGSTGEPKGAVIPHTGVLQLMEWGRHVTDGLAGNHRFLAISPLHFDNSVFDLYCGLFNGSALLPVETAESPNPAEWAQAIERGRASLMFAVPTLFLLLDKAGLLTPERLAPIRHFLFGGEGFPIHTLRTFYERFHGRATLTNVYGPTETSCICASLAVDASAVSLAGDGFLSLGSMHPAYEYSILDVDTNQPVAKGVTGELWIGGPSVGLGYYADPTETSRRFLQDPRQGRYRSIWYRTGDLVRQDTSGKLWFGGRTDNQVKLAGHRIELEEIDAIVESHPAVDRCAAVVATLAGGDRTIAVVFEGSFPIAPGQLAEWCRTRLPAFMLPRRYLSLPALPRNANGKLDRRQAQDIVQAHIQEEAEGTFGTPPTTKAVLIGIWEEVLGHSDIDPNINFFDLGGTSLLLLRARNLVNDRLGIALTLTDLFANSTITALLALCDEKDEIPKRQPSLLDAAKSRAERASRGMRQQV